MKDIKTLNFHKFCVSIAPFPENFINSLSNAELLYWLCNYLEDVVIPTINQNGESVQELQNLYVELKNYVDNYFTNLDLQTEIDNKLDEMAENGTLLNIITNYLSIIKVYNTTTDMINDENIYVNQKIKTNGYYQKNDGGKADFFITNEIDETQFQIKLKNGLYANLVLNNSLKLKQIGCKNESENFDNTELIQKAIEYCENNNKRLIVDDIYLTNGNEITKPIKIIGTIADNSNCLKAISNSNKLYVIKMSNEGLAKSHIVNLYINGNKTNNETPINGIYCTSSYYKDFYLLINNCTILNCHGNGIVLTGDVENRTLRENRIINNEICYNDGHGVYADSLTDSIFENNTFHHNGFSGSYLKHTGSIRILNCKAFWNGLISDGLENISHLTPSCFNLTADNTPISNKKYYTRSGKGTWQNPYKFQEFTDSSFNNDTNYYEANGTYFKKYPGFLLENANDSLINNCDIQDNCGDGIQIIGENSSLSRNISICNTKLDNNGLLIVDDTATSYDTQSLKQIYNGIYCDNVSFLSVDVQANNTRYNSIGYSQYSGVTLKNCENVIMNLNSRLQMNNFIIESPTNFKNMSLNINGKPYVFNYDLDLLNISENYEIVNDGWNTSFIKIINNILYYNLILKNNSGNIQTSNLFSICNFPSEIRPSSIINCENSFVSNNSYNKRNNTYISYIDNNGNLQLHNETENQNIFIAIGHYNI